jgi:hypothetical protein
MVAARFVCVSNIDEWSRRASRLLKVVQFKYLHYKGEPGQMMTARRKRIWKKQKQKKKKRSSTEIEKKGPTSWANRNLDRSTSLLETRVLRDSELSSWFASTRTIYRLSIYISIEWPIYLYTGQIISTKSIAFVSMPKNTKKNDLKNWGNWMNWWPVNSSR